MSDSRSGPRTPRATSKPAAPRPALDALLAEPAGDPIRRALWLDALDRRLRPCLPPSLAAHARLANLSGDKLVFMVDAPVWHARLRLAEAQVLDAARSIGLEAGAIVVKTTTAPLQLPRPLPPAAPMSSAARDGLQTAMALLKKPDESGRDESEKDLGEDQLVRKPLRPDKSDQSAS